MNIRHTVVRVTHALESCPALSDDTCSVLSCAFIIVVVLVLLMRTAGSCVGYRVSNDRKGQPDLLAACLLDSLQRTALAHGGQRGTLAWGVLAARSPA